MSDISVAPTFLPVLPRHIDPLQPEGIKRCPPRQQEGVSVDFCDQDIPVIARAPLLWKNTCGGEGNGSWRGQGIRTHTLKSLLDLSEPI